MTFGSARREAGRGEVRLARETRRKTRKRDTWKRRRGPAPSQKVPVMATIAAMTATPSATTRAMSWQPPILRLPRPLMVATRALECGALGRGSRFVRPTSELPRARLGYLTPGRFRRVRADPRPSARARRKPKGLASVCEIGRNARSVCTSDVDREYASSELKQSKPGAKNTSRVASPPGDGSKPRNRGGRHRSARFPCKKLFCEETRFRERHRDPRRVLAPSRRTRSAYA